MSQDTVYQLEREVEAARAKLANDLTVLRSPETAADFTQALKQEAKSSLDATIHSIIEDVKGRAAANPAAALAIGAGLAWRFIRHPPIATALIGAGLVSLFRTPPIQASNGAGYRSHARSRLEEQASQVADYAAEQAAQMSTRAKENAAELASAAKERVREWAAEATSSGRQAASDLEQRAAAISSQASDVMSEMRDRATAATRPYAQSAGQAMQSAQQAINEPEARDKLLLGSAGVAIVAAMSHRVAQTFSRPCGRGRPMTKAPAIRWALQPPPASDRAHDIQQSQNVECRRELATRAPTVLHKQRFPSGLEPVHEDRSQARPLMS